MKSTQKEGRYERIRQQIVGLIKEIPHADARMATIIALLHHKFEYYYWTGFYLLRDGELIVSQYQGPIACLKLKKNTGVCWAGINTKAPVIVPDVEEFPGHIACSSQSKSEIVVPLRNKQGEIIGVLDVDSKDLNSFDDTDAKELEKILLLVYDNNMI